MAPRDRVLQRLLAGNAHRNIPFDDLLNLLRGFGFAERRKGSHVILSRNGIAEIINLQPLPGGLAKPYQIRQVRKLLLQYGLAEE